MESNFKISRNKYFVQKVGTAVQYEKGTGNEHFLCAINKKDLLKCNSRVHKNRETAEDFELFNLSLKRVNEPVDSVTHFITDSLYHKSRIDDVSVDINLHLEKSKISTLLADTGGLFYAKAELNDKNTYRDFNLLDYKVYLTTENWEKVPEKSLLGYANRVDHERDFKRQHIYEHKIEREFIGSGFIVHNDLYPLGQVLTVKTNKERLLNTISDGQQYLYIHIIPVKNNPQQMAAYTTKEAGDKAARFILRIDREKLKAMQAGDDGYIKFSGFFNENVNNSIFNITVKESLTKHQEEQNIKPLEIGVGADKGNIQIWQDLSFRRDESVTRGNINTGKNFNI